MKILAKVVMLGQRARLLSAVEKSTIKGNLVALWCRVLGQRKKKTIATQIPTVKVHSDGQNNVLKGNDELIRYHYCRNRNHK